MLVQLDLFRIIAMANIRFLVIACLKRCINLIVLSMLCIVRVIVTRVTVYKLAVCFCIVCTGSYKCNIMRCIFTRKLFAISTLALVFIHKY